jgi:hypothetical protein
VKQVLDNNKPVVLAENDGLVVESLGLEAVPEP